MEEEQIRNPIPATHHILQQTLRSLCNIRNSSQWVYAVFWRILPRIYPPPKWDGHGGAYDRSRGNRRNWILVWEDGFCNFGSSATTEMINGDGDCSAGSSIYGNCEYYQLGLQPELFFKMSHEVYNYGEGLIGKVAADHSHKWIYKEHNESQEIDFLSVWQNSADSHPRTWEAQFHSGIKTIALIAVREGVVQLGSVHKVMEDLNYVVLLREKFNYIESIPGVLLPHSSSSSSSSSPYPFKINGYGVPESWHFQGSNPTPPIELSHDHFNQPAVRITPSMSSLEALLSKLPAVVPPPPPPTVYAAYSETAQPPQYLSPNRPLERMAAGMERVTKEEIDDEKDQMGESSNSIMSSYPQHPNFYSLQHHNHWILKGDP